MSDILVEKPREGITVITLNRPNKLNALTYEMIGRLYGIFDEIDADPDARVVILTGAGRGFCAGLDLGEFGRELPPPNFGGHVQQALLSHKHWWARLMPRMRTVRVPIVSAVNGPTAGAGFVLAAGSDIRIAAKSAKFHDAFIKIGLSGCELGLGWILPRLIGASAAADLMLTGRQITADEAKALGLVVDVVNDDALMDAAMAKAEQILANTPYGVWMTKEAYWASLEISSLHAAIELESRTQTLGQFTADAKEQLAAMREKRKPTYHNA